MARGVNQVILLGRMTRDIEIRETPSGKAVGNFSLAVNRGKEEVDFIEMTAWEKTAEIMAQYTQKGSQLVVVGSLRQETWEDKDSGKKRSKLTVTAHDVTFVGGKGDTENVPTDVDDEISLENIPF